ncbi:hypothetical protein BDZ45DRAFT_41649 [Acephala macrosclerotiorum]|nr:hypothetical protein BDZ45DRAFT_41649 [Acephala macrosclerotiorum]
MAEMAEITLAHRFADICHVTCPSVPASPSQQQQQQNPASTSPNTTASNPGFPLFTLLPFELRIKIWQMTIEPRIVVNTKKRIKTPAILHTCHEAREEGLRHYQLMRCAGTRPPIYISVEDTLFFTTSPRMGSDVVLRLLKNTRALQEVRHLAISRALWERIDAFAIYSGIYDRIETSKVLESLTIVNDRGSFLSGEFHFVIEENGYEEEISWYRAGEESTIPMAGCNALGLRYARLEEK